MLIAPLSISNSPRPRTNFFCASFLERKSEAAVKDLQHRFQITVDGVVGPQTWAVIDALEDEGPAS
jgi:murein L,D-transpeptidase YcbB/YkuD